MWESALASMGQGDARSDEQAAPGARNALSGTRAALLRERRAHAKHQHACRQQYSSVHGDFSWLGPAINGGSFIVRPLVTYGTGSKLFHWGIDTGVAITNVSTRLADMR